MLILTRRVGETVMIGNEVTVTVLGRQGQSSAHRRQCPEGRRGPPRRDLRAHQARRGSWTGRSPGSVSEIVDDA